MCNISYKTAVYKRAIYELNKVTFSIYTKIYLCE